MDRARAFAHGGLPLLVLLLAVVAFTFGVAAATTASVSLLFCIIRLIIMVRIAMAGAEPRWRRSPTRPRLVCRATRRREREGGV